MNQQKRLAVQAPENFQAAGFSRRVPWRAPVCLAEKTECPSRAPRRVHAVLRREAAGRTIRSARATSSRRCRCRRRGRRPAGDFSPDGCGRRRKFSRRREMKPPRDGRDFSSRPADSGSLQVKLQSGAAALESHFVAQIHRLHDGFEFVKAVGAFAEDVQQQVDFAGRFFFKAHCRFTKAKRANGKSLARRSNDFGHGQLSKTLNRLPGMNGATSPPLKPM